MKDKRTLDELTEEIEDHKPLVGIKPYSHNIISLLLQQIAEQYGHDEANNTIIRCGLEPLGWMEQPNRKEQHHEGQ